jgi:hypothetical protein
MKPEVLLSKRYSLVVCYLLLAIDELQQNHTLESLYSTWKTNSPSRSAFVNLIADLEEIGWIDKVEGEKKSARKLIVDSSAIRSALLLEKDTKVSESWLFSSGVFDFSVFEEVDSSSQQKTSQTTVEQASSPTV